MRSPREISFRLLQEARNLAMLAHPPRLRNEVLLGDGLPHLPPAGAVVAALRGSEFAAQIIDLADEICAHRFPIFGGVLETGADIRWRRDYQRGIETGLDYFRLVPYLDPARAGDHKLIWEINRHQHLVVLAQAYRFTGNSKFTAEMAAQLESWLVQNPFQRGMNWASALEVAFRALSWIWVLHLAGDQLPPALARDVIAGLYRHGLFLENNLSVYFSPNTHLLGEAVVLDALGRLFPAFPESQRWKQKGSWWIAHERGRQVREDGGHFEQSSYYHVYALDMFLFHAAVSGEAPAPLERMAEYLASLLGVRGTLPFLGDDDGGRLFHPYGARETFGRATLATCGALLGRPEWVGDARNLEEQSAWWFGPRSVQTAPVNLSSRLFRATGIAVMTEGKREVIVDCGPFGPGRAGHSHSDTLSVVAWNSGREILIDPGTFTYVGDAQARNWFRGSAAHNTIQLDELDQAEPRDPFAWSNPPEVRILDWRSEVAHDFLDAECRYRGFAHRRRVLWIKPDVVFIFDDVSGPSGEHSIEQFWHLAAEPQTLGQGCLLVPGALLTMPSDPEVVRGWRSPVFGSKEDAPVLRSKRHEPLPSTWATALIFGEYNCPASLKREKAGWRLDGPREVTVADSDSGVPRYRGA